MARGTVIISKRSYFKVRSNSYKTEITDEKFEFFKAYTSTNPMTYALSELLRGQLELTENFLNSQKQLYSSFVNSLNSAAIQQQILEEKFTNRMENLRRNEKDPHPGKNAVFILFKLLSRLTSFIKI
jgi:hypothetical protein